MNLSINQIRPNQTEVSIGEFTFCFSYQTCVGFYGPTGSCFSENIWSNTTGKHLTYWCDKSNRIPNLDFEELLSELSVTAGRCWKAKP